MEQNRIGMSDIHVGKPLPWNAYNARGQLLLKKGFVIESLSQVVALVEQGLYADASLSSHGDDIHGVQARETPSVLRMINLAEKRLERLLLGVSIELDFPARLMEVATSVVAAVELNADIALASILLNQQADDYPIRHCLDTAVVAILVARSMKLAPDEITTLTAAALTMNVGMLRQQYQLQHRAEAPSAEEIKSLLQHQQESAAMLEAAGVHDVGWLAYVRSHHEYEDDGYAADLAGEAVPPGAKILTLADRYCASVSERKRHKSQLPGTALREIFLEKGKGIDPTLAAYFIKVLGLYPPGTLVRLNNGDIGVVSKKGDGPLTPIVHALVGPHGVALSIPVRRDTASEAFAIKEALHVDQADIRFSMHQVWGEAASL